MQNSEKGMRFDYKDLFCLVSEPEILGLRLPKLLDNGDDEVVLFGCPY